MPQGGLVPNANARGYTLPHFLLVRSITIISYKHPSVHFPCCSLPHLGDMQRKAHISSSTNLDLELSLAGGVPRLNSGAPLLPGCSANNECAAPGGDADGTPPGRKAGCCSRPGLGVLRGGDDLNGQSLARWLLVRKLSP